MDQIYKEALSADPKIIDEAVEREDYEYGKALKDMMG